MWHIWQASFWKAENEKWMKVEWKMFERDYWIGSMPMCQRFDARMCHVQLSKNTSSKLGKLSEEIWVYLSFNLITKHSVPPSTVIRMLTFHFCIALLQVKKKCVLYINRKQNRLVIIIQNEKPLPIPKPGLHPQSPCFVSNWIRS